MAKEKPSKSVPNKSQHLRISYLYQAANYLSTQRKTNAGGEKTSMEINRNQLQNNEASSRPPGNTVSLASTLGTISQRTQIRISKDIKRSICKRCNTLLVPGITAQNSIENKSINGQKPWADVLVVQCIACSAAKRFPVGAKRQESKAERAAAKEASRLNSLEERIASHG
ncbi:hypothetical protein LTS18_003634 [Coniosporium uncinatum]|uniref:Uncharacterized protein n=1 Tax=Coniosporium uncinatum TaxID=93489 RepID=A0ACC3DT87_9PEZI|nr:hypothetical protein LTS18_003634 [Coniosporium uncinatum]